MQPVLSNYVASINELKKFSTQLLEDAGDEAVAILSDNVVSAYLVPSSLYEKMIDIIDDHYLAQKIEERLIDEKEAVRLNIDEL